MKSATTWRRERDSNPRTGINRYTISNRAPSTNSAISASIFDCLATTLAIIAGFRLLSIRFLKKVLRPLPHFHGRITSPRMIERRRSIMRGAGEQIDGAGRNPTLFHTTLLNITTTIPSRQ